MSQPIRGQGGHLGFLIDPKNTNLSSFLEFHSMVSEEMLKMSQPIRGRGGHLGFLIGPKNTNLVEGIKFLLTIKFRRVLFSSFRG